MKKKLFHLLIPLLAIPSVMRADELHSLIISFHEGDSVAIVLADKPCATFFDDSLRVETAHFSASYLRSAVADFHFGWYAPTEVNVHAAVNDMVRIVYTDKNRVQILGVEPTILVAIHHIGGSRMAAHVAPQSDGLSIDLTAYPAGIYFITLNNNQTIKIMKQ